MSTEQESYPPENRRRATATVLAWGVILLMTALVIGAPRNGSDTEAKQEPLGQVLFTRQVQYLLGAAQRVGDRQLGAIQRTLEGWKATTDRQRIRLAVLVAEVQGPEAALQRLREVQGAQDAPDAEPDEGTSVQILTRVFEDLIFLAAILTSIAVGVAVLHPQGLPAVPGIVGIALALACMREWRTTLVPSIVAHAVNNGVIMLVLIALLKQ